MITKIIACSDIHVPSYKGIDELKEVLSKFIVQCHDIISNEPGGAGSVRIVVAGDIFHNKTVITNESIMAVDWFFKELDKLCKTYVVIGNHDFNMENHDRADSLTPLFEIGAYKQVVYLDRELGYGSGIYEDGNVAFCLYSSFSGFAKPDIAMYRESKKGKKKAPNCYVGIIHGDVNGAITVTNYVTEHGLDPSVFDGCDFVIAGHIHKRQEIKRDGVPIVYCSSIKQRDYGESVSGHGFVLWSIYDDGDFEYRHVDVPNDEGGYYILQVNGIEDIEQDKEEFFNY